MVQMCMIQKQVKQFGKKSPRLKIDINKSDNLEPGTDVVILTADEYAGIKQNIINLTKQLRSAEDKLSAKVDELQIYKDQEQNLKQIIEDVTTPIYENHQKELSNKGNELKRLQDKLDALERKTIQYNLDMQGLNAIDILILRKHKKLIQKYNDEITVLGVDPKIVDADAKAIPGKDSPEQ